MEEQEEVKVVALRMNTIRELIQNFLDEFCEKVGEDESDSYIELMMDNHRVIDICLDDSTYVQYYVPRENSCFSKDDEMLQEMLLSTYPY